MSFLVLKATRREETPHDFFFVVATSSILNANLESPFEGKIMTRPVLSRRQFVALTAGAVTAQYCSASVRAQLPAKSLMSAQQMIDLIHKQATTGWPQSRVAGLKAGNPEVPVRGIATTAMATIEVLKQASKAGLNLIFTNEPTFYGRNEGVAAPASATPGRGSDGQPGVSPTDPVLLAKKAFIEQNGIVIYRIGDGWTSGNDLSTGLGAALGWSKSRVADDPLSYSIEPKSLGDVLADIKLKLGARGGMRVVGDPHMKVQRVALLPGLRPLSDLLKYLPQSDLVIIGESRDWEGPEYSSDANAAGFKKGYAQIGRVVSEDPGMLAFSKWVQSFVKDVPVRAIAAGDPYWRPA
jgi:NIF3 (NGG1p interacting factor 3)